MKSIGSFVVAFVVMAVSAGRATAGQDQGDRFRFSVNTRAEYTDNRDASETDEASNWDFYLRPRADVLLGDPDRALLDLYYAPSIRYRTDPSIAQNETELQHDLGLHAKYRASRRLVLRASEKFDLTDDGSVSQDGSTIRGDRSYIRNDIRAGADFLAGRQTEVDLSVGNRIKRYDEADAASTSDEDRTDAGIKLIQHFSGNTRASLEGRYSLYSYESPGLLMRDFDSILGALGVEKMLSKNLTVGGQLGAQMQSYDDPGINDSTSPFARLFVRGSTTPSLRLNTTLTHAVRDSDAFPFASQEYSELSARADWDTTPHVTLTLSGLYRLSNYDDVAPSAAALAALIGRDETTIAVSGQAAYKLNDSLTVQVRQRFEDVDSDVSTSFSKNTTTLELTKHF
ncbi:MAG: outer membrane beta-barrel protein [Lentisphaerae bacterium]|nr:outer membrane beta-barrel protein [Lentisphaerota bacterium]